MRTRRRLERFQQITTKNTHSGAVVSSDTKGTPREPSIVFPTDRPACRPISQKLSKWSRGRSVTPLGQSQFIKSNLNLILRRCILVLFVFHQRLIMRYVPFHVTSLTLLTWLLRSDLSSWREIFQRYINSKAFESLYEAHAVSSRGLGDKWKLKLKQSHEALQSFLELNMFILNIKKLEQANADAICKILKKHAKQISLPLPFSNGQDYFTQALALAPRSTLPLQLIPH
ncbi:hypothetical protein BDP27DRAFT_1009038 [Rhodocollybia butyracea]|uniref:Uncharacterized protein n=1 Tax=Rhodocollybia butyracea TaxID=206335 RepID=A0A9P5P620_9AGAR|nr:hypothetical protein BDP27DRAFT_1009038 [Rhodocollybia butyracea]